MSYDTLSELSSLFVLLPPSSVGSIFLSVMDRTIDKLLAAKKYEKVQLFREEVENILDQVKAIIMQRPMLVELTSPIRVLGDIHGQYFDLMHIFDVIGLPSDKNQLLFLGDYVDRGKFGIEVMCLLFALKIRNPDAIHLIRGNHESASVSRVYGFYEECKNQFDQTIWKRFMEVFDCLPVAALINSSILCMHGGLSPHLKSLDDIRNLTRPQDVPPGGLYADLLWSDPDKKLDSGWGENPRGVSFTFAKDVVEKTNERLKLDLIMRAHQVVYYGYELFADSKLITLFTAPNFCGQFENLGGIANIDGKLKITLIIIDGRG